MKRIYFLSIPLFLSILVMAIVSSAASISLYLCLPCLILTVAGPFFMLLGSFTPREMGRSFLVAFSGTDADKAVLATAASFFKAAQSYVLLTGFIGALIGVVAMLAELTDKTNLGFGLALVLMTILYSLCLLSILVIPFRVGVQRRLADL